MVEEPSRPKYSGKLPVDIWEKKDKNGKTFLSVKIGQYANCFEVREKAE